MAYENCIITCISSMIGDILSQEFYKYKCL